MPSPRRLALSLVPGLDESLDSYLERLAWRYGCSLADLAARTGLAPNSSHDALPAGYWVDLPDDQLVDLASAFDIAPSRLRRMLLSRFDGVCLSLARTGDDWLRRFAVREWVYVSSSHACPSCLAETDTDTGTAGVWQTGWRLPWTFASTAHDELLAGTCPRCKTKP